MESIRLAAWGMAALLGLSVLCVTPAVSADLLAGAAKVDITPSMPVYMAGYDSNRMNKSVKTPLSARALVIKSADKTLAIVGVDSMGVPSPVQQEVRALVKSVPADAILIGATHDHSAPDLFGLWGPDEKTSGVNPEYLASFKQKVAAVIDEAAAAAKPAKLKLGSIQTQGIIVNHRPVPFIDRELSAMQFVGEDGKVIATLANLACHAEIMQNDMLSGDFPYYFYQKTEKDVGGVAIFMNGAEGGMITADIPGGIYSLEGKDNSDQAQRIGELVAAATQKALEGATALDSAPISLKITDIAIPMENEGYKAAMKAGLMPDILVDGKVQTKVAVAALGPAQIVTIPGEMLPNLGLRLKRNMTGSPKFLFGLTMDELGYIVSADDFGLDTYKYESYEASMGSQVAPVVMGALLPMIAEVKPLVAAAPAAGAAGSNPVAAWFAALPGKFKADKAEGVSAVYCFKLSGDGGGDYTVAVKDKKCTVENKAPEKADLTVSISASDWLDLVSGKLDPMAALGSGKLVLDGDIGLAMQLGDLFLGD